MSKGDGLDLSKPKAGSDLPKVDPDPLLGRFDHLLLLLERIAVAAEDLVDILEGQEDDGARPDDEGSAA
jgi:hypothetical protein